MRRAVSEFLYGVGRIAFAAGWFVAIYGAAEEWGVPGFLAALLGPVFLAALIWAALDW